MPMSISLCLSATPSLARQCTGTGDHGEYYVISRLSNFFYAAVFQEKANTDKSPLPSRIKKGLFL